jgi:hypothetical protein
MSPSSIREGGSRSEERLRKVSFVKTSTNRAFGVAAAE